VPGGRYPSGIADDRGDPELVAAAQGGDRGALEVLLRRHYDRIHGVCRRLAGNDADALDAAQEACIAITRGLGRFDGRAAFATWAYRVATNACLDELRRRRRRPEPGLPDDDGARLVARGPTAESLVGDRLDVDAALALLAPEIRAAVVLRDLCDLDYAEIAETLDIPPGTVRSRIARGRVQLARHLAPEPDLPPPGPSGEPDDPAPASNELT
jgi:RNA polymerase sigma-70 factor, ECF subfamily